MFFLIISESWKDIYERSGLSLLMGVDLGALFKKESCSLQDFQTKVISIDAYNVLHQFLSSIRQRDGTPLKDSHGRITSHLSGLLYRTANLVESEIYPVYVFDGAPHPLKQKVIEHRQQRRLQAEIEWKDALERGDLETAKSKAQQTSRVDNEIIDQSMMLLDALGIPFLQAPGEGEAQASYMVKKGNSFAVGSQDFDCLLFGASHLVRNLTSSAKRKLPGKQAYIKVSLEKINLHQGLQSLGITHQQLVDVAILIGTDFNEGIQGFGPKKSLQLIQKFGDLEAAIASNPALNQLSQQEIDTIRAIFLKPSVTDDYRLSWSKPDRDAVISILCDDHQFSRERIEPILDKFHAVNKQNSQKNLFDFG